MIEKILAMFDAIDSAQWERLRDFFSQDCVYERPGYPPIRGLPDLERFYREERRIESGRHQVVDHFERPGGIMVIGNFTGRLRDGASASLRYSDAYSLAGGLIAHRQTFFFTPLV